MTSSCVDRLLHEGMCSRADSMKIAPASDAWCKEHMLAAQLSNALQVLGKLGEGEVAPLLAKASAVQSVPEHLPSRQIILQALALPCR